MSDIHSNDFVAQWAELMEEWTTVSRSLDIALEKVDSSGQGIFSEWQRTADEARKRQDEVRQRIGELINRAMSTRRSPVDGLVIGQIAGDLLPAINKSVQQKVKKSS
ncbi:hypothetical protein [Rhizobium herbae]